MWAPFLTIRVCLLAACSFVSLSCGTREAPAGSALTRPNILILITDDQAATDLGVLGHPWLETPAMDRLVTEGFRMTRAFVPTSRCSPARASLLTGCYTRRHGVLDNASDFGDREDTLPVLLGRTGYDTGYVGKWHMGDESGPRPGFAYTASYDGQGQYEGNTFHVGRETLEDVVESGWVDDAATDHALAFLHQEREGPFFLMVGFKSPHRPRRPPMRTAQEEWGSEFQERTSARTFPPFPMPHEYESSNKDARGWPREQWAGENGGARTPQTWPGRGRDREDIVRDYYRVLNGLDQDIARLLDALDSLGVTDDTIVVLLGDNGIANGEHGMIGKCSAYEESMRIPLVLRYPRLGSGETIDDLVLNMDLMPTLLELAQVEVPSHVQGRSLAPVLERGVPLGRESFLYEYYAEPPSASFAYHPSILALRTERFKLVTYPGYPEWEELYDLREDPLELTNLARLESAKPTLLEMRAGLIAVDGEAGERPALDSSGRR